MAMLGVQRAVSCLSGGSGALQLCQMHTSKEGVELDLWRLEGRDWLWSQEDGGAKLGAPTYMCVGGVCASLMQVIVTRG